MLALLPFVALLAVFYFLAIRPQQQQQKAHAAFIAALESGDEVVTSAGVYGTVTEVDGDVVWLEVAKDLELKIERSSIARSAYPEADEADEPADVDADEG